MSKKKNDVLLFQNLLEGKPEMKFSRYLFSFCENYMYKFIL